MAPLKPSLTVRSSSSAAASGTAVGKAAKAAKRGLPATTACSRSLTRRVKAAAVSAGSFCVDGAPCEIT